MALGVVSGASVVMAQEPGDEWQVLNPGESRWVALEYLGDGSQIEIRLNVEPEEGAAFGVWTPEQMQRLEQGEDVEPVGRGSADPYADGHLTWSGSFGIAGTYYVEVEHTGSQTGATYYQLDIVGDGVWFSAAVADESTSQAVAEPAAEEDAQAEAAVGTGPDDAQAPDDAWHALQIGEHHWYAFSYVGDGSEILIQMGVVPDGGAAFSVWTPAQIQQWALGEDVEPVGRGSADPYTDGSLIWAGSFNTSGTYYVMVEHSGHPGRASYYQLSVHGDGVSP
jgi:hypothetical protein